MLDINYFLEEFDPEKQTDDLKEFFKMEREKLLNHMDIILKYLSENKNTESGKKLMKKSKMKLKKLQSIKLKNIMM